MREVNGHGSQANFAVLVQAPPGRSPITTLRKAPALLGAGAQPDGVGDTAPPTDATLRVEGCTVTSGRDPLRRRVAITIRP